MTLNCMECDSEVVIGEVADDFEESLPEWMRHNLICDPCLADKFGIVVDEIIEAINNDMEQI